MVVILHPYCSKRAKTQAETWRFLLRIDGKYHIVNRCCDGDVDYPNLLLEYWGKDDIVVIEQDKVPTEQDLEEIINCPEWACIFPYTVWWFAITQREMWEKHFPYGLGFVKFKREIQQVFPSEMWEQRNTYVALDRAIERPMIKKFGPMHLHQRWVKHNHGDGITAP